MHRQSVTPEVRKAAVSAVNVGGTVQVAEMNGAMSAPTSKALTAI